MAATDWMKIVILADGQEVVDPNPLTTSFPRPRALLWNASTVRERLGQSSIPELGGRDGILVELYGRGGFERGQAVYTVEQARQFVSDWRNGAGHGAAA